MPEQLPAALLLHGQKGVGKQRLAHAISQSLLCQMPAGVGYPCGSCDGCHLFEIGNHPDFRHLQPEKDCDDNAKTTTARGAGAKKPSALIGVDAVRSLADLTTVAAHRGGAKVIMVTPAEALHSSAGNAMLKMLEEPGRATYFVLITNERNRVLPTIRSRCFQLPVKAPASAVGLGWLKRSNPERAEVALCLASHAPFAALELIENEEFWTHREVLMTQLADPSTSPLELASVAEALDPLVLGRLLSMWVFDLLALQQGANARYHRDMGTQLARLAAMVAGSQLCRWSDQVREFSRAAEHPLNRRLALESLFSTWPGSKFRVSELHSW